jgi:ligand-binding sensor domain-containing protein/class 3 adenylate cyclase
MRFKIIINALISLVLFLQPAVAQNNTLKFYLVEGPEGKPLGKINAITQDPHGYMWFAGQGEKCIYRYDGNRLIAFRHDALNPNSLGMTSVETIYADDEGMIWIGGDGLDQYNPSTGIFKHYRNAPNDTGSLGSNGVNVILKDHQGRLWVGTGSGLDRLDEKTGKFIHYRTIQGDPTSISSNIVRAIYEDRKGVIWIGTGFPFFPPGKPNDDGGLNRLNPDGTFTRYLHDPKNPHSLINNKVRAIFEDRRGVFWVGTSGDGLHTMEREKGSFERYPYDPAKPNQLSRPLINRFNHEADHITFINEDNTGTIWIGTYAAGLTSYNPGTKKITRYQTNNGFQDSSCWNGYISSDGVLWISTENSGLLYRVDPLQKSFSSTTTVNLPNSLLEDKDGFLWVGTEGNGLLKFDQRKNLIKRFKPDPSDPLGLPDNRIGGIFQNQEDSIWVGTYSGIRILNTATQQFSMFQDGGYLKDSVGVGFSKIFRDKKGIVWFGRWGLGLIRYNPKDNTFKHFLSDADDSTSLSTNSVNSIVESSGALWVGGLNGINRLNRETGRFNHYLANTFIAYLYEDSEGTLWAGTAKGLYRYNEIEDRFTGFFDPLSEIYSFTVGGIIEDNTKNLWLVSPSAIIKLNPRTKETFIYGSRFGIVPNSLAPWVATYKNTKGQLVISHQNGFYSFFPEEFAINNNFKIIITNFFINTIPVLPGKGGTLQKPVEEISDLVIKYNQNNIAFDFTAIDYREPGATKYFTMLENYDNTWREAKGEKSSYYFNVPPGKYVYRVKAFNSDGTKGEKAVIVTVNPPFWQTWWFRSLVGLFLLASLYIIYRWRTASLRRQKRVLEQTVKIRTAEVVKQKEKSDELLLNILPAEVANELKEKGYTTAKSFDEVTVLFSDIKGFTNVAEKMTAQQLVKEIDTYFSAFDNIILHYGLEKIKTIGDAYIAAGGLPEKNSATAQNVIEAAIAMQQEVEKLKQERITSNNSYFELRIGIHTGPVVAGVVGIKKFQYDIWGDTVNLAARMEQSGVPGKINISQHTYEVVKEQFTCVHRGKIEAKNKGDIDMYFVELR